MVVAVVVLALVVLIEALLLLTRPTFQPSKVDLDFAAQHISDEVVLRLKEKAFGTHLDMLPAKFDSSMTHRGVDINVHCDYTITLAPKGELR